jgi:hypothetical protein
LAVVGGYEEIGGVLRYLREQADTDGATFI